MSLEIATPDAVAAARQRVAGFLEEVGRLRFDAFAQTGLSSVGAADGRASARTGADRIAREVGLDELATEARAAVRAHIVRLYGEALYRPTMVGLN